MASEASQGAGGTAAAALRARELAGALLAVTTVTIWGVWIVGTRFAVTTTLEPHDTALLRFLFPAVALAPFWLRMGLVPRGVPLRILAPMILGAGLPFYLTAAHGFALAPAAHASALLPSSMSLFTALIGWLVFREQIARARIAGFTLIVAGALGIGGLAMIADAEHAWRGYLLFMAAAMLWAIYTHAFNRSGLAPLAAVGLVCAWSVIMLAPVYLVTGSTGFDATSWGAIGIQFLLQGVISGLIALTTYSGAVERLGASRAAAFGALVPVVATLTAIPVLGEIPDGYTIVYGGIICLGVVLASGVLARRRPGRVP